MGNIYKHKILKPGSNEFSSDPFEIIDVVPLKQLEDAQAEIEHLNALLGRNTTTVELHKEIEALKQENEKLEESKRFTSEFYAVRFQRLRDLLKDTPYFEKFCAISANGTANPYENPTYAQQLNIKQWEIKRLGKDLAELTQQNAKLKAVLEKHHAWHLQSKQVACDNGFKYDLAHEYTDSSLYEETSDLLLAALSAESKGVENEPV